MKEMNTSNNFTWIKFFNAMLKKICSEYDKKTLYKVFNKVFQKDVDLGVLDPLTFIAFCNYSNGDNNTNKQTLCDKAKKELELNEFDTPSDFDGIPYFDARFQRYFFIKEKENGTIDFLWKFAKDVINHNGEISDNLGKEIDSVILKIHSKNCISWAKISKFLFICFPDKYFPADKNTIEYTGWQKDIDNFEDFKNYQQVLKSKYNELPYIVSNKAWIEQNIEAKMETENMQETTTPQYWLKSSNPKKYDLHGRFQKYDIDFWEQLNNFNVNDILFFYSSANDRRIRFKTVIERINITPEEIDEIDKEEGDWKEFWNTEKYDPIKTDKNCFCFRLLKEVDDDSLSYENLVKLGYIKNAPQGKAIKITNQDFIDFLNSHFEGKTSMKPETKQNNPNIPLNQILFGPPGTGKTYSVRKYINAILSNNPGLKADNEEQRISYVVKYLKWYSAIALAMYSSGKKNKYLVSDILNQKLVNVFAQTKENKNLKEALWGQLQIHTDPESLTVKYKNRSEPFIFDKTEDSKWYLTDEGIKFVEENLSEQLELLNAKNQTSKIEDFYKFITFHQSYSYEEFIEGIKPVINDDEENYNGIKYEYNKGIFKEICQKANSDPKNKYLLIIDEINRGNISKIFGELITLIESDKRVNPNGNINFENTQIEKGQLLVNLPYTKSKFGVPSNLYILGTMNTSDRSIATIDIALRRRFKFIEMMPDKNLVADFGIGFKEIFEKLNTRIKLLLDRDHQIGHSYFINTKYENADAVTLKEIWFSEIIPLLNEYFYCDWEKLRRIIPGFLKQVSVPDDLKGECEDSIYEFKTMEEVSDLKAAFEQKDIKKDS